MLAACATGPVRITGQGEREKISDFSLEARFALRIERPHEEPASASGRLSWEHAGMRDRILIANPLGQGIAAVDSGPEGARLQGSDGQVRTAAHAARLIEEATGYPLPVNDLPNWLLGRPGPGGRLQADTAGRPLRLEDAGWKVDYDYDDTAAGALPARLTLHRGQAIEIRLRIEEWQIAP